jgi:hypothetical protein
VLELGKSDVDGALHGNLLPIRMWLMATLWADRLRPNLRRDLLRTARNLDILNGVMEPRDHPRGG